jgi:hypothetical protein
MFIGHFAVGLAAKSRAARPSLGTYFAAAQLLDLLWPLLLLVGLERVAIVPGITTVTPLDFVSYPFSHSLLAAAAYAAAVAVLYYAVRSDRAGALFLGGAVLSHWVLDAATHRPDLPLAPGASTLVGFGLWQSLAGTLVIESAMFAGGIWLYLRSTKPLDRTGTVVPWSLFGILYAIYLMNLFAPEPPPNTEIIAWSALGMWLFVALAAWGDRHRAPRS